MMARARGVDPAPWRFVGSGSAACPAEHVGATGAQSQALGPGEPSAGPCAGPAPPPRAPQAAAERASRPPGAPAGTAAAGPQAGFPALVSHRPARPGFLSKSAAASCHSRGSLVRAPSAVAGPHASDAVLRAGAGLFSSPCRAPRWFCTGAYPTATNSAGSNGPRVTSPPLCVASQGAARLGSLLRVSQGGSQGEGWAWGPPETRSSKLTASAGLGVTSFFKASSGEQPAF